MYGQRTDDGEERHVAGHLETELDRLLQADGDYGRNRGPAQPPGRTWHVVPHPAMHLAAERRHAQDRGDRDEQPPLGEELQVVVVGFTVKTREIVPLVE